VLGIYISEERNMLIAEKFIRSLIDKYGKHTVYTDGGTWYLQACTFLHLKHRLHSHLEKSLIERVVQYFKDRNLKIELNLLMTITHAIVKEEIVIMIMCITG
jgi:putative transposase